LTDLHDDRILILDFGSQYTQLIARRVREAGVYSEIYPWDADFEHIREFGARGFILSGGPESTLESERPEAPQALFADVNWSTPSVLEQTLDNAQKLGYRVSLLETLRDIDTLHDLEQYPELLALMTSA